MPGPDQRHISACDGDISWQCTAGWSGSERFRELLVLFFFSSSPLKSTFIIVHYWFISSNSLKEATAATPIGDETPLCILHPDLGLGVRFLSCTQIKERGFHPGSYIRKEVGHKVHPLSDGNTTVAWSDPKNGCLQLFTSKSDPVMSVVASELTGILMHTY